MKIIGKLVLGMALLALGFFLHIGLDQFGLGVGRSEAPAGPGGWSGKHGGKFGGGSFGGGRGGKGYPGKATSRPARDATPVEVATPTITTIHERVKASGVLEAERMVTVTARVPGDIDDLFFEEGDTVEAEASLCSIDRELLELAHDLAEAQRDRDKAEFDRMLELKERNISSDSELDAARYAARISETTLQQAVLDLSFSRPQAPFAGIVVRRHIEKGQYLREGDPLYDLGDFSPLRMRVHLPEAEVRHLANTQPAELRLSREAAPVARGQVERISPVVDLESLTVEATLTFDEVPDGIRPGSLAHVDIITKTHEDVLLVPRAAVLRQDDVPHVFRVIGEVAQRVQVTTGYEDETWIEITEGLGREDLIVVVGHRELRDHSPVKIYGGRPRRGEAKSVEPKE